MLDVGFLPADQIVARNFNISDHASGVTAFAIIAFRYATFYRETGRARGCIVKPIPHPSLQLSFACKRRDIHRRCPRSRSIYDRVFV
jgi:hypothetical protein